MYQRRPICLTIAGFDPSGGAGIVADLRTFEAMGCFGEAVITTQTVQNSKGVKSTVAVDENIVRDQLFTLAEDLPVRAIKIGMVGNEKIIRVIVDFLKTGFCKGIPVVLDPIVMSSSGHEMLPETARKVMMTELLPHVTLVTPNIPEAEHLRLNAENCPTALLIKGGHGDFTDRLYINKGCHEFYGQCVATTNTHGTGCVFSSAITAALAKGRNLTDAVGEAKNFLEKELNENKL